VSVVRRGNGLFENLTLPFSLERKPGKDRYLKVTLRYSEKRVKVYLGKSVGRDQDTKRMVFHSLKHLVIHGKSSTGKKLASVLFKGAFIIIYKNH
jgi:hypothetical protein